MFYKIWEDAGRCFFIKNGLNSPIQRARKSCGVYFNRLIHVDDDNGDVIIQTF